VTEIGYTYDEQTVTGIDDLTVKPVTADDAYYNLQGQRMNSANLPAGIYIQGGKKLIVK
jgi:hypothetical protein